MRTHDKIRENAYNQITNKIYLSAMQKYAINEKI